MVTPPTQVGCVQGLRGVSQGVPRPCAHPPPSRPCTVFRPHGIGGTLRVKLPVIYQKLKFNWHPGFYLLNVTVLPGMTWVCPCEVPLQCQLHIETCTLGPDLCVCVGFPFKEEVSLRRSIASLARVLLQAQGLWLASVQDPVGCGENRWGRGTGWA